MSYLTIHKGEDKAESLDGKLIPANYQEHNRYSSHCNLSLGLNYLFHSFVPDRSYSKGYELRKGINLFLDFVHEYESLNPLFFITSVNDISSELFFAFDRYCKKHQAPKNQATRLKGAFEIVARDHDDGMPLLTLPLLPLDSEGKSLPFSAFTLKSLKTAFKEHVDKLNQKLRLREQIHKVPEYTLTEVLEVYKNSSSITETRLDKRRILKTLIILGHPFHVSFEEFRRKWQNASFDNNQTDLAKLLYGYLRNPQSPFTLHKLLGNYYPTPEDMAGLFLFIQLQTGWNKETVMAIDPENYESVLTGALDTDITIIFSEKNKSQNLQKPFSKPKSYVAYSNKKDKYSTYNLINLAKELALPFGSNLYEEFGVGNPLYNSIRGENAMAAIKAGRSKSNPGRFASLSNKSQWATGVTNFFHSNVIEAEGKQIKSSADINRRLRPTWVKHVRDNHSSPLSLVGLLQGHEHIATTDVHYDSSGPAMQKRRERLRSELDNVFDLLYKKKFKGLIKKPDDDTVDLSKLRIFQLPGHDRALWACSDSYSPDWSTDIEMPKGQKCSFMSKCLFCSRICVFEDSLPFLMARLSHIQTLLSGSESINKISALSDELEIIDYILDQWGDSSALRNAARYQRNHKNLLPQDLNLLSILFED